MAEVAELGAWQIAFWYTTACVLVAAGWVTFGGQHRNPRHDREMTWWLWHWMTGGLLEVARSFPSGGRLPRRIARRAGKATGRAALAAAVIAAVYLRSGSPYGTGPATIAWLGVGSVLVLAVYPVLVAAVAVEWSVWRHYIRPLHWAISGAAGWWLDMRWWQIRRYIKIPRGRGAGAGSVMVACGPSFKLGTDAEKEVVKIVTAKLGLTNVTAGWKREGIHRYVEFIRQDPVPADVAFRDVRELIERESTPGRVLLGLTRAGDPVWLDIKDKAPHVLISAGTGGGKSVTLAGIAAQLMWHGAEVVVLDIKRISHLWLRDLPSVRYARAIEEIHRALCDLKAEVERRTRLWDPVTFDQREAGEVPRFPRLLIVFDEISSTMSRLRDHWTDIRESGDPTVSPAIRAWSDILNMGRQVDVNTLAAGQRGSANAVGSGDARENFPMVILVDRYSKKTWDMLASECPYAPGVSHAGRAQVIIGATATETQLMHIKERDAQRWVIDKRGSQPRVPHPTGAESPGETVRERPVDGTSAAVTLWEAAKDTGSGIVDLNYEALKKAAQRDRAKFEFPDPVGERGRFPEYDPRDLQRWEPNRVRTQAVDGVDRWRTNEIDGVDRMDEMENESLEKRVPVDGWLQGDESPRDIDRVRFWTKVDRSDPDGCWPLGDGPGYAWFWVDGKSVPAHRFAYEDQVGPIPEGYTIDHRIGPGEPCTTKRCQRGDHLQAVTNERNVELRHERDRARNGANG